MSPASQAVQFPMGVTVLAPVAVPPGLIAFTVALDVAASPLTPVGLSVEHSPDGGLTWATLCGCEGQVAATTVNKRTGQLPNQTVQITAQLPKDGDPPVQQQTTATHMTRVTVTTPDVLLSQGLMVTPVVAPVTAGLS